SKRCHRLAGPTQLAHEGSQSCQRNLSCALTKASWTKSHRKPNDATTAKNTSHWLSFIAAFPRAMAYKADANHAIFTSSASLPRSRKSLARRSVAAIAESSNLFPISTRPHRHPVWISEQASARYALRNFKR